MLKLHDFCNRARLTMDDVDLDRGTLLIRNSKRRTRIVPMRDDLVAELRLYVDDRCRLLHDRGQVDSEALFVRLNGAPLHTVEGGDKPGQWSACDLLSAAV
jgi:integrase